MKIYIVCKFDPKWSLGDFEVLPFDCVAMNENLSPLHKSPHLRQLFWPNRMPVNFPSFRSKFYGVQHWSLNMFGGFLPPSYVAINGKLGPIPQVCIIVAE